MAIGCYPTIREDRATCTREVGDHVRPVVVLECGAAGRLQDGCRRTLIERMEVRLAENDKFLRQEAVPKENKGDKERCFHFLASG